MDAGATSGDESFLARVASELALGDPLRGIKPWVRAEFGQCADDFVKHISTMDGLELPKEVKANLGLQASPLVRVIFILCA